MGWEILIIGAFAVLTIGRIIYEVLTRKPAPHLTKDEQDEYMKAIK